MRRQSPKKFLNFVRNNWDLLEDIHNFSPLSFSTLKRLVEKHSNSNCEIKKIIQDLQKNHYIIPLPESTSFELDNFLNTIIEKLCNQYRLGLAEVVQVYINKLEDHVKEILSASEKNDKINLLRHLTGVELLIKDINSNIENNNLAINSIVLTSKTRDQIIPMKQRYAEVFEAWDKYVIPLGQMLDVNGSFESILGNIEKELNQTINLGLSGMIISEKEFINQTLVRVISMRSTLKEHYSYAQEQLKPLVESFRRNTALSKGASVALKMLSQNRLDRQNLEDFIEIVKIHDNSPLPAVSAIESFICNFAHYEPQIVSARRPEAHVRHQKKILNYETIKQTVSENLPISDLMKWLLENINNIDSEEYIDLYFQLIHDSCFYVNRSAVLPKRYETKTHFITAGNIALLKNTEGEIL